MSLGAEPIGRYKVGLIALSSASQREAFFLPEPLPVCLAMHNIYRNSGPTWHLPFVFFVFFLVHLCLPLSFFLSASHRLSTTVHINNKTPPPSLLSGGQRFSQYQHCCFLVFAGSYVLNAVCNSSSRHKDPLTHLLSFSLWVRLVGCVLDWSACICIKQKSLFLPAELNRTGSLTRTDTPAEMQMCFIWLASWESRLCSSVTDDLPCVGDLTGSDRHNGNSTSFCFQISFLGRCIYGYPKPYFYFCQNKCFCISSLSNYSSKSQSSFHILWSECALLFILW